MIRRKRRTMLGSVWLALSALLGIDGLAADGPPRVVGTRFVIAARTFTDTIPDGGAGLAAEVGTRMAVLAAGELSYLQWRPLTNPPSADDPVWVLKGTLVASGSSKFFPEVTLRFDPGNAPAEARPLISERLYRANDPEQPTQDFARFREELLDKVQSVLSNTDHLRRVQTQLLARIPVASTLEPRPALKRVLLPARWSELLPGEGSQFKAEYAVLAPDGNSVGVRLLLAPSVPVSEKVACSVMRFEFPPLTEGAWHEAMPASISNAIPDTLRVFVSQYVKDYSYSPSTMNGLVLQPDMPSNPGGVR